MTVVKRGKLHFIALYWHLTQQCSPVDRQRAPMHLLKYQTLSDPLWWKHSYQPSLLCMCTQAEEANDGLGADAELNT